MKHYMSVVRSSKSKVSLLDKNTDLLRSSGGKKMNKDDLVLGDNELLKKTFG
jgi:hypothetical protein